MSVVESHLPLAVAAAVIAGAALYLCWLRTRAIPMVRRLALLALRTLLFATIIFAILNPRFDRPRELQEPPLVAVAVDVSRSMTDLPPDGESRYSTAFAAVDSGDLATVMGEARVESYLISDGAESVDDVPPEPEGGSHADLRRSLSEILRRPCPQEPVACVLISDGADGSHRPPARVAQALRGYGVPVYCIGVGSPEPVPDISIPGLVAPRTVTEGEQFELRALVDAAGLEDEVVELSVTEGERQVATRRLEAGHRERPARFQLTAGTPGYQRYTVTAPPHQSEVTAANNRRSVLVRIEPAEARLLLIEGRPRREYAFLRRLLLRIEDLETKILLRKADPAEFWFDHEAPRRADIDEAGDPGRYRAVILSNIEAEALGGGLASRLSDYVFEGGALAMLGGPSSFGGGGWADSPVATALPVRMSAADGLLADAVAVQVTEAGELPTALRDSGVQAWHRLPLLEGMNRIAGVASDAQVAVKGTAGGQSDLPVVITGRHGAGRTLAVTVDDTWRWRQSPPADEHSRAAWEAFWTAAVGWLIAPREEREVILEVGRDTWESGGAVRADVHVIDEEMEPIEGANVTLTVVGPEGEREIEADRTPDAGIYGATWRAGEPGTVRLTASARRGSEDLGQDTRTIEIIESVEELTRPAQPEVLRAIAEETGGAYLPLERAAELRELLPLEPERHERTIVLRPARTTGFFLLVVLIAGADWLLRRRWSVG